jgi:hypothetical protein
MGFHGKRLEVQARVIQHTTERGSRLIQYRPLPLLFLMQMTRVRIFHSLVVSLSQEQSDSVEALAEVARAEKAKADALAAAAAAAAAEAAAAAVTEFEQSEKLVADMNALAFSIGEFEAKATPLRVRLIRTPTSLS